MKMWDPNLGKYVTTPLEVKNLLDELFSDFEGEVGDYKLDISWGEPVGREIW